MIWSIVEINIHQAAITKLRPGDLGNHNINGLLEQYGVHRPIRIDALLDLISNGRRLGG